MRHLWMLALLAACAPQQPIFKPVEVDIPIAEGCAAPSVTPPDFALSHLAASQDLFTKTKAALTELDQRKAYEIELEAALAACRR